MLAREANVGDTLYFDCDDGDGLRFSGVVVISDDFVSDRTHITTRGFFDAIDLFIEKDIDAETFKKTITALYKEIDFYE
jgi:hypothetical protein